MNRIKLFLGLFVISEFKLAWSDEDPIIISSGEHNQFQVDEMEDNESELESKKDEISGGQLPTKKWIKGKPSLH